jgi:hypothetical protein
MMAMVKDRKRSLSWDLTWGRGHAWRPRSEPFKGEINIGQWSSLRKRMRAVRRGKMAAWWPATPQALAKMKGRYAR